MSIKKEQYEQNYESMLKNSVGPDKRCPYTTTVKKALLSVSLFTLTTSFILSGLCGCAKIQKFSNPQSSIETKIEQSYDDNQEDKYHGFSLYDISTYQRLRTYEIMEENGFNNYTTEGTRRNYNYTSEDFKKLDKLDETYLYGFYTSTTGSTLNQVCGALGYENLEDFLIKNNYVDSQGNPSTMVWSQSNSVQISNIMAEQQQQLEHGKGGK